MKRREIELQHTGGGGPTVAELAFLGMVRTWTDLVVNLAPDVPLKKVHYRHSWACLLLAVEWGHLFSPMPFKRVRQCVEIQNARLRKANWYDDLIWELCLAGRLKSPVRSNAVDRLMTNFDHENSGIRLMMLELGWAARPWLKHPHARYRLLRNLCYAHVYSNLAYVLAESLSGQVAGFAELAAEYTFPEDNSTWYQENLAEITSDEIPGARQHFCEMEADARKLISNYSLDKRLET